VTVTVEKPAGPPTAETDPNTGSRWYIHPTTGERFISVTTVLGYISKFGLPDWSARLAAEAAFNRLPWLNRASRVRQCNATKTDNACGVCRDCVAYWLATRHTQVRDDAGELGSKLHAIAEQDALFGEGAEVDEDVRPFVDQFRRWRTLYRPEFLAAELTVISRKWGFAGTLDGIVRFPEDSPLPKPIKHLAGLPVCGDYKTSKSVDIPKGWQVVAYSKADAVLLPDGSELPMPEIKGGLIVHIRPNKVQMREVHLTDANFAYFVHMCRVVEGLTSGLNSVLSRPVTMPQEA
jgi:hypothetical protein